MEFHRFAPPSPPPETHAEAIIRLPTLLGGTAVDRLERAQSYLRNTEAFTQSFHLQGASGTSVCRVISAAADGLLRGLWEEVWQEGTAPDRVALVALGSYGRNELAPHSDLDLLLLRGRGAEGKVRHFAAGFSTLLWDLKRSIGWSVRTATECVRAADEDHTIRTAILDARLVAGDAHLFQEMQEGALRELFRNRVEGFIADKLLELQIRRQKFGDSIFLLEPEVKKGEGGLRDLEAALWIAQARFRIRGLPDLLRQSILSPAQAATLKAAQDFLLRIRHHLHYRRGRKEDRLTFDLQEEVARLMGYTESTAGLGLGVEQFMRHYYLSAKALQRGSDSLIIRCQEKRRRLSFWPTPRRGAFKIFDGRLTLGEGPESLRAHPEKVLQLFRVAEAEGLALDAWSREQVDAALPSLAAAAGRPEVVAELKSLFLGSRAGRFLTEMHELGALGAVIPEFGRITALHQHDLYHVYTVDAHTLFAVKRLYSLRAGELAQEQPELTRRIRELTDPLPLFLGMLLHDAGKGLGGGHSEHGRRLAQSLGERLGLNAHQREVTEFLVYRHLNMSHVAQRRDISDPELIAAFAREVGTPEKLTCLYLLTYADINSTGPRLWTQWKAQLLHDLFHKTLRVLQGGEAEPPSEERAAPFVEVWSRRFGPKAAETLRSQLPARYFLTTRPEGAGLHAQLLFRARQTAFASAVRYRPQEGYSELSLVARDQPGLLAAIAGILSAHRIDILRAHINSTTDGWAIDLFDVRGASGPRLERQRWRAARRDLIAVLAGELTPEQVLSRRRPTTLFARHLPRVPPRVAVDNSASADFTVVDVQAQDRTGLLHTVADAIRSLGAEIAFATVATEAHKAIDSFYITRGGTKLTAASDAATFAAQVEARLEAADDSR